MNNSLRMGAGQGVADLLDDLKRMPNGKFSLADQTRERQAIEDSEAAFQLEDPSAISPEEIFERQCALVLLETALGKLAEEHAATGREKMFALLRPLISPDPNGNEEPSHEELSRELGLTAEASRAAIYRMRKRFRELLRETVADTLARPTPEAVDEELDALREALSRHA